MKVVWVRVGIVSMVEIGAHSVMVVVAHIRGVDCSRRVGTGADYGSSVSLAVRMVSGRGHSGCGAGRRGGQLLVNGAAGDQRVQMCRMDRVIRMLRVDRVRVRARLDVMRVMVEVRVLLLLLAWRLLLLVVRGASGAHVGRIGGGPTGTIGIGIGAGRTEYW